MDTPYNTRSKSKKSEDNIISIAEVDSDLNSTLREDDERFSSFISDNEIPDTQTAAVTPLKRSLSNWDMINYTRLMEENDANKALIEQLQCDNMEMQNAVIRKDELIVRQECELSELKETIQRMASEIESLKVEEVNLMKTIGVLSDDVSLISKNKQISESDVIIDKADLVNEEIIPKKNKTNLVEEEDADDDPFADFEECMKKIEEVEKKKRKVVLVTDSHGRCLKSMLNKRITSNFNVESYIYPGGTTAAITKFMPQITKNLTENDFIVTLMGTNDTNLFNSKNWARDFDSSLTVMKKSCENINHLICEVPARHDKPHLNLCVKTINGKLKEKFFECEKIQFVNSLNLNRNQFTRHGLHLNINGKLNIVNQVCEKICKINSNFLKY